jgi:hypothetical protein
MPSDHPCWLWEVVTLGDDLGHALVGHAEDRGNVDDAQVALLDQGENPS